ncbi:MAG TPA: polyprenyl synthetase family protein [Nevskiaceae bacterium]|nr:polyprenyl synthetase family protein [Nevskiaceae bacterium]
MELKNILAPVADDLKRVDAMILERLRSQVSLINEVGNYLVSAGGKRMRPAMVLLVARALGCTGEAPILLAATIEFIHTATLLHDDVVDGSGLRRSRKTANALWGNSAAVLSGDFLYSRSFQMMVDAGSMDIMRVMADTTNAIAEGEVLQLVNCGDPDVDQARYLRVIELKTARLFEAGARTGAICAGADMAQRERAAAYGRKLGIAFQLIDDVLDYCADPAVTGKNIGADLAEGKPTLPLIRAMAQAPAEQAETIRDAIAHARVDRLNEVLKIVESTDAIPYTRALAERHGREAVDAIGEVPASPYKDALIELARYNNERGS